MNIGLSLPSAKKGCIGRVHSNSFPVTKIADGRQFTGIFTATCVEVFDADDIRTLYDNGCYGIGSHTKGQPKILTQPTAKSSPFVPKSQLLIKQRLKETLGNQNPGTVANANEASANESDIVIEANPYPLEESLVLSLEEAFFLHHCLKCLKIARLDDDNTELSTENFLNICCALKRNFISYYIAYRHYRRNGWIVKNGLKFGGDFLLYYKGPRYYHASYVVIVADSEDSMSFLDMQSNFRVAETANKQVVIVTLTRPHGSTYTDDPTQILDQLQQWRIDEFLPKRFQPNQHAGTEQPSTSRKWKKLKMNASNQS